jgi:hypothetical protein
MRLTLGSRGLGRHASRRSRLFATSMVAAGLGLVVVSATGIQKTYGATNKAPKLPPIPVCAFGFGSQYAPSAGEQVPYTLTFSICKSVKLTLVEVRPAAVTKVEVLKKPKPTRWVHGGPVWVQNVSWRTYFTRALRLRFAKGLQTGQKVKQKFIFRAPGYRPDVEVVTQTIYNPSTDAHAASNHYNG